MYAKQNAKHIYLNDEIKLPNGIHYKILCNFSPMRFRANFSILNKRIFMSHILLTKPDTIYSFIYSFLLIFSVNSSLLNKNERKVDFFCLISYYDEMNLFFIRNMDAMCMCNILFNPFDETIIIRHIGFHSFNECSQRIEYTIHEYMKHFILPMQSYRLIWLVSHSLRFFELQ